MPGNRLYTVKARNYVCAIGLALARTGTDAPYGSLCFESLGDHDGMARDVSNGQAFRAHRSARVTSVVYDAQRMLATAAA